MDYMEGAEWHGRPGVKILEDQIAVGMCVCMCVDMEVRMSVLREQ
jgi:hypothetical protein